MSGDDTAPTPEPELFPDEAIRAKVALFLKRNPGTEQFDLANLLDSCSELWVRVGRERLQRELAHLLRLEDPTKI